MINLEWKIESKRDSRCGKNEIGLTCKKKKPRNRRDVEFLRKWGEISTFFTFRNIMRSDLLYRVKGEGENSKEGRREESRGL